ncbi:MAG TPA: tetratricopeptide repeat protein [Vicinamibacterales bacterium]|nr:tetratricopeptide repeat protein [Vicinamibacterales bacterium]
MIRGLIGRHRWLVACAALFALSLTLPAAAQSTGMIRGSVKDASGKPVEGAKISIDADANNRHFETKSDKKGEFVQIGLPPGAYKVSAEKDKVGAQPVPVQVRIGGGNPITLVLGAGGGVSPEAAAKNAELKKTFEEGVAASRAGNHDAAITAFTHAAELNPNCYDCYYNIAFSESQKKDYEKAEAAYKKAIELKADYAEAYNGLANIYNATRKFDEAAAASAKAMELSGAGAAGAAGGGGGNADAMFNQGVILWNAGKIAEAKKQFEGAVAANPSHAEAHYQLGMALVNEGNLQGAANEFETYLKLAPTGPNAATAKGILGTLKK